MIDFERLREPFPASEVRWRLAQTGKGKSGIWAKCLAYLDTRSIQDRLDFVVGPENWKNEFTAGPAGGVLCGLSIRVDGEWITKYDVGENTDYEAIKGGVSDAEKRAAVQWGIGRYLYDLKEQWAEIVSMDDRQANYTKDKEHGEFRWYPPKLPNWALPGEPSAESDGRYEETMQLIANARTDARDTRLKKLERIQFALMDDKRTEVFLPDQRKKLLKQVAEAVSAERCKAQPEE